MSFRRLLATGLLVAFGVSDLASAQDFSSVGDMGVSMGAATVNHVVVNSTNNPGLRSRRASGSRYAGPTLALGSAVGIEPSREPVRFVSTDASWRQAQSAYLDRLGRVDRRARDALAGELARNDFRRVYAGIVRPFGLRADDAADALAGYTVLGWLIATGAPDPSPAAVRAARDQFAGRLAAAPDFRSRARLRDVGEELKISFVTLHAGWQSARREGNLRQYGNGVAALFRKNDIDLRALRLTNEGFVAR